MCDDQSYVAGSVASFFENIEEQASLIESEIPHRTTEKSEPHFTHSNQIMFIHVNRENGQITFV